MVVAPELANKFIQNYKAILLTVCKLNGLQEDQRIRYTLVSAREFTQRIPNAIDEAIQFLENSETGLDEDIVIAIRTMRIGNWYYLRDTTKYSIFLDEKSENGYAVLGLIDPLREVTNGGCTFFEAGVFQLNGHLVCDGLANNLVHIGPGIRASLNESFKKIKQNKRFFKNAL